MFVRDALPSDYDTFLACFRALEVPDPEPTPAWYAERLVPSSFLVCEGTRALGWGYGLVVGGVWHVGHVATLAEHRRRGVGQAIMAEHARRARAAGRARWRLNVKPHNAAAIRLYERCGLRAVRRNWSLRIAWRDVARMPSSCDGEAVVLPPHDDAQVEDDFTLDPGELADWRARVGRVLLGVRAAGRVVAWASFDPTFPGASPFRPSEPRWSAALLGAIRAHALADHDHVRVMIQGDEDLARALLAAGAETALETLQVEGDVPAA